MRFIQATLRCAAAALVIGGVAGPAFGHHSFSQFDMQKAVTIEGTVQSFQWANPHIWIDLVVRDSSTQRATPFAVECDAVGIMQRKGWTRKTLKPGDKVTVTVHPLRNGQLGGSLVWAALNGERIGNALPGRP